VAGLVGPACNGTEGPAIMTICELDRVVGGDPNAMRYSMKTAGEALHHPRPATQPVQIMTITAARLNLLQDGLECHQIKRDALAAALRSTYAMQERANLLLQHADTCRCITAFELELAKA
jgi:hypothetical protein